jgi:hypothetical protein
MGIGPDPITARPAEELVHGHPESLVKDVPHRLLYAADRACKYRPATVEGAPIHGLPVTFDLKRVLADQISFELPHGHLHRLSPSLDNWFAVTHKAFIRMHL